MAGFCCIWIPNFGLIHKPLYDVIKGSELLELTPEYQESFDEIKRKLMEALVLAFPALRQDLL